MTSKQRAYLRGLANPMEPILHVGKDGVGENLIKQADDALEARELVKGAVLQNSPVTARGAGQPLRGRRGRAGADHRQPLRALPGEKEGAEDRPAVTAGVRAQPVTACSTPARAHSSR